MAFSNPTSAPFPYDIPIVQADTLSLSRLRANDERESEKLFKSCTSSGLFYLDLSESEEGNSLIHEVDEIFSLSEEIFDLDLKTKNEYLMLADTVLGYKAAGTGRIDAAGTPDRCEFWCLSKNDILNLAPPLPSPPLVTLRRETYVPFIRRCHALSMLILSRLETVLGLPAATLQNLHRIDQISSDQTRQIKYSPQPLGDRRTSLVPHTDYGSITILFNTLGGLQLLPDGVSHDEENWAWVKPAPSCAIINLGDAMVKFTNGLFKSPMHRVTYAPGEQALLDRYSLAYFTRPEDECVMKRIDGSNLIPKLDDGEEEDEVLAGEWIKTRVKAARVQKKEDKEEFPEWAKKGMK